jgi:Leucine-rich repeat (LRR) protein
MRITFLALLFFAMPVIGQEKTFYSIKSAIEQPNDVRTLVLDGLYQDDSLTFLKRLPNLETLTIKNNPSHNLPSAITEISWLRRLKLINSDFFRFPHEVANLSNLEAIELVHDSHIELKSTLFLLDRLPNLKELRIEGLSYESVSDNIHFPPKIKILSLRDNQLNKVPAGVKDLAHLEILDLGENELFEIPPFIAELKELKVIYLDHEPFLHLDQSMQVCAKSKSLKEIHMEGNQRDSLTTQTTSLQPNIQVHFKEKMLMSNPQYAPNLQLPAVPRHSSRMEDASYKIKLFNNN